MGVFEDTARYAIKEIVEKHGEESKFGVIITPQAMQDLTDDLFNLLQTSRNLKTAGDRLVRQGLAGASKRP